MTTKTRTDVHRPSAPEFDPEAYECLGVYDMNPEYPNPWATQDRLDTINDLINQGYHAGPGSSHQCGHCGTHIRYAALMVRHDVKEWIYVGQVCLDERFEALTAEEFRQLRETAALNRERVAKVDRIAALVDAHPLLADLTYPEITDEAGGFVYDVAYRFLTTGRLSERQVEAVERAIRRNITTANRKTEHAAEVAAGTAKPAPTGRVTVTGEILAATDRQGYQGRTVWKMMVRSDDGWRVWATVPDDLIQWAMDQQRELPPNAWVGWTELLKGKRVRFDATLSVSADDATFAFAKRPTKVTLL